MFRIGNSKYTVAERLGDVLFYESGYYVVARTIAQLKQFGAELVPLKKESRGLKELTVKQVGELLGYEVKIVE